MAIPTSTPYFPIQVAAALRFINSNGDLVTQMYPTGATQAEDSPQTGYISLIGSTVGNQVTQITQINQILTTYAITLNSLQSQITTIQTSGAAMLPSVNGGCFSSGGSMAIADAVSALIASECSYRPVLGTPTALSLAILAQCTGLNTLPAFSQNSAMAGLAGWKSSVSTVADAVNNLEVSYCDSRAGISRALAAVTPTCAQVLINFAVSLFDFAAFNFYFNGYTFIPTGYTDNGSTIQVTDGMGGVLLATFDIVAQSTSNSPFTLYTSGSTLSPTAESYTVTITSDVHNTAISTTCEKTIPISISVGATVISGVGTVGGTTSGTTGNTCCPDIGTFSFAVTSGSTSILTPVSIVATLPYTPRFIQLQPMDYFTGSAILVQNPIITYFLGGGSVLFNNSFTLWRVTGTANIRYIAFR